MRDIPRRQVQYDRSSCLSSMWGTCAVICPPRYIGIRMGSSGRDKNVEAALDRFHTLGFNGCGVQEIVDKAGVPKGACYNYFKAKELLALEVLQIYTQGT